MHQPSRIIATALALGAFSVAVLSGIAAGNPADVTLGRALVAMFACQIVGFLVGLAAEHLILEHVSVHRETHPLPEVGPDRGFSATPISSTGGPQSDGV